MVHLPYSFLNYTPVCRLNLCLMYISIDCSVWLTVAFTFDRFVAICLQTIRSKYCLPAIASKVMTVLCVLCILENIPIYFLYEPREIIDRVPWSCIVKSSFYTSDLWFAYLWIETIFTPFLPFLLILLFNSLTVRNIILTNRVRNKLRGKNSDKNITDPEIENRRKSIILLITISGNFILLWMVTFACFVCVHFTDNKFTETNYTNSFTIAEKVGYMLRFLSTCTNTFIYVVSQRNFREELKSMIVRPFALIVNLLQ